jgi:hypothetical protein
MGHDDGRGSLPTSTSSFTDRIFGRIGRNGNDDPARRRDHDQGDADAQHEPTRGEALDRMPGIESRATDDAIRFPGAEADVLTPGAAGGGLRMVVREFLEAVPRPQAQASIALVRPDGTTRVFTRGEFSAAVDAMRPRMRQIVRLAVEERWSRQRVCDYLNNISIKTFERDHAEAFDALMEFVLRA